MDKGLLLVSDATPAGYIASDPTMADWLWFKPSTGVWHKQSEGSWVEVDVPAHEHAGVTGRFDNPTRLDIVNGIVMGVEEE